MTGWDHLDVGYFRFSDDDPVFAGRACINVKAGRKKVERIVPPAGEKYAFDRDVYPVNVEVMVSRTGRSVQVHVNGERVA